MAKRSRLTLAQPRCSRATSSVGAAATCEAVHPETKKTYGYMRQFAVAADTGANATSITLTTPLLGPLALGRQTVLTAAAANAAVNKIGAGNAGKLNASTYFHRDAFAIAFADLEDPGRYGAWGSRQVVDNVSIRIWRQGDITNGTFPCRLDVLVG